jgi:SAM-dependent methyltransferase
MVFGVRVEDAMITHSSPALPIEAPMPSGPAVSLDADALLQASRRVDWRFLLPDPNLGRVAFLGPARGPLLESLRLFSTALAVNEPAGQDRLYDVVVAVDPTHALLRRAARLLRPDGHLYVEAHAPFKPAQLLRGGRPRFAAGHVAAMQRLGLVEAVAYWHWPNFESCAEIVPLGERDALLLALARRRSGAGAWLKSALGHALLRSGLFERLAPCFSVVARKPEPLTR